MTVMKCFFRKNPGRAPISFMLLFLGTALCLNGLFVRTASAADAPSRNIKLVFDQVRLIVTSDKDHVPDEETDRKLKEIIVPLFDFEEMSRRSLGAFWNKATADEKKQFVDLFSDLLARTYLKRIKRNSESSNITKMTDEIEGDKAMVRSTVMTDGEEISLDYRMMSEAGTWKIYDVVIENVGLVSNYRNEFPAIIRKEGFSGLIARLREKNAQAEADK
jgi:phospholipid transport system substrate-binding protein